MEKPVLCFGEVLWDTFGYEKKAGGAPMNVARHLVQQGVKTQFASRVGNDYSGQQLSVFLKDNGLYSPLIQQDDQLPTCEVTVQLDKAGAATYVIPEPVSWDNIQLDKSLIAAAKTRGQLYSAVWPVESKPPVLPCVRFWMKAGRLKYSTLICVLRTLNEAP